MDLQLMFKLIRAEKEAKRCLFQSKINNEPIDINVETSETQIDNLDGYIYCLSNPSFVGLYKVGFTKNSPLKRIKKLNNTSVPFKFKIEFAKKVTNCIDKEKQLHFLLSKYGERVNSNREFFKIDLNEIKLFFNLIDGEWFKITE